MIINFSNIGSGGGSIDSGAVQTQIESALTPYYTSAQTAEFVVVRLQDYTPTSSLAPVATSNDYADLDNKPTIPTVPTSNTAFTNDAGYITSGYMASYWTIPTIETFVWGELENYTATSSLAPVATSGEYSDLLNKPTIPTVPTSNTALTNDAGYITDAALAPYYTSAQTDTAISNATSGKVDTSVLANYYTSAQTDTAITTATANMVTSTTVTAIWKGSQNDYDSIGVYDNNTLYIIV